MKVRRGMTRGHYNLIYGQSLSTTCSWCDLVGTAPVPGASPRGNPQAPRAVEHIVISNGKRWNNNKEVQMRSIYHPTPQPNCPYV